MITPGLPYDYTPKQNGLAERLNRTLMESARSMMCFAGLPNSYWGKAVVAAAYIRNRVPTRAFKGKVSPYERWCGVDLTSSTSKSFDVWPMPTVKGTS